MTTTVRILGSRTREQVPGTSITLLAPGFRGALTQFAPGVASNAAFDLPFAEAAACADVMLAAQLTLQLEARPETRGPGLRSRSAMVMHPRVIVPRRRGVTYALLQTDETGTSSFIAPQPGDESEVVFRLRVAAEGATRRTLRVLMWPDLHASGQGSMAVASRWENLRRPYQLAQLGLAGRWQPPHLDTLRGGVVLLLLHDTFSTPQAAFADWLGDASFAPVARRYQGRCLAFTHPTLSASIDDNVAGLLAGLEGMPGSFDVVAHGRGGLLARALAVDGRLALRRVCQIGTPNNGTPLARESQLAHFLDAHVAMLATTAKAQAQCVLEGALCLMRCVAQGLRAALPGVEVLTPESAPLRGRADFRTPRLEWYTVGAQFETPEGHAPERDDDAFRGAPNDLIVPSLDCHHPGIPVNESLHVSAVHHHQYFADARVRERLATWLM